MTSFVSPWEAAARIDSERVCLIHTVLMVRRTMALPLVTLACGYSIAACGRASNGVLDVPLHVEMHVEHLGLPAREPMVVELPSGTLFWRGMLAESTRRTRE